MPTEPTFDLVKGHGWTSGLANLWRKENQLCWGKGRWLRHMVIWIGLINGFFLITLLSLSLVGRKLGGMSTFYAGIVIYMSFIALFVNVGAIVLTQGNIIQEKQSGTAAWILSKPVARSAFIIAKCASIFEMTLTMVLIPGVVALLEFSLILHQLLALSTVLLLLGWIMGGLLFFFCLTLLLGTLFKTRTPVIGIGLVLVLILSQLAQQIEAALASNDTTLPLLVVLVLIGFAIVFLLAAIKCFEYGEL